MRTFLLLILSVAPSYPVLAQPDSSEFPLEPFRGIFFNGLDSEGLFPLRQTGVSTEPVRRAAVAFLAALSNEQRKRTVFAVTDDEWLSWDNRPFYPREGVSFQELTPAQREAGIALMRASLSARGLRQSRDIMRLNGTLAELTGQDDYGEWSYYLTVMGEPSATEPWGWQVDGHHLVINYFVLGDQVVMSPVFMGSEPIEAKGGRFKGTIVLQDEQDEGLRFVNMLNAKQRDKAIVKTHKEGTYNVAESWSDNHQLDLYGIPGKELNRKQRKRLLKLIEAHVGHVATGHARIKMDEVAAHLDDTWFAWVGPTDDDAVFYYRIQSPVVMIEFDHQYPIAYNRGGPMSRDHVHVVVRTPNGNDYGKDLLRQHLERHHSK